MSKNIESISEFLIHAGTQYLLFDLGRCQRAIDPQAFLAIENGQVPAPYPRQQHFWCGIVYWNKNLSEQRYIWFLKLPLDERGYIVDAARQHFLEIVVTALANAQSEQTIDLASTEQNTQNPYIFVPNQQQLADFNAHTRAMIGLPPCDDYQVALNYLQAPFIQDWQNISLQGLADVIAFADEDQLRSILTNAASKYPMTVLQYLFSSLENTTISQKQVEVIIDSIDWQQVDDSTQVIMRLRALAQMSDTSARESLVENIMTNSKLITPDLMIVIAGRHWQALTGKTMMRFLEHLAALDSDPSQNEFFCSLFADIAQLPETRESALKALREPDRSARLSQAIGALFQQKTA